MQLKKLLELIEAIHVIIEEMQKNHYGVAGVRKSDAE